MGLEICLSARKPFPSVTARGWNPKLLTYHPGYGFEIEARQFYYVSQFEYGAQRSFLWMVEAFTDVGGINPLHQVTPETNVGHNQAQVDWTFGWVTHRPRTCL